MEEITNIPEKLGWTAADREERNRTEPYSQLSYQARYLLYDDEAAELLKTYHTHSEIRNELERRYRSRGEYRERIDGGYDEMTRKMKEARSISQQEQDLVDRLNDQFGPPE